MNSKSYDDYIKNGGSTFLNIKNSTFNNRVDLFFYPEEKKSLIVFFEENTFNSKNAEKSLQRNYMASELSFYNITQLTFTNNKINGRKTAIDIM